jgi:GNAT superfamily N-acetyltransferase
MQPPVTVRPATLQDATAVAALSGELGYPVGVETLRGRLQAILASAADRMLVAADASGDVVGWLQAHATCVVESGFRVEITGLVILPAVRRRGVGRALVAEAERWAKNVSAESIVVRSNANRLESHSFYPALGYTLAKTQQVYRKRPGIAENDSGAAKSAT